MISTCFRFTAAVLLVLPAVASAEPLDCVIEPSLRVEVSSAVQGILENVIVSPGERVMKGDVLARLESSVELTSLNLAKARAENTASLTSAQGRYQFYKSRLDRSKQLFDRKAVSSETLERAETEFIIAENELKTAETDLLFAKLEVERALAVFNQKTIRSPFDGIIARQVLDPGALVGDGAVIFELASLDPLKVRTFAPVSLFPLVSASTRATVLPQAPFDTPISARITLIDSTFDVASGTFTVELSFDNPDHSLPSGLKCTLEFETGN